MYVDHPKKATNNVKSLLAKDFDLLTNEVCRRPLSCMKFAISNIFS